MENLPDLISRLLRERGDSLTAFADRIGVTRQTVARWNLSLPAAETLRRVADDLKVPYSQVLSAALASTGYINTLGDMLAGQQVHIVTQCEVLYGERGEVTMAAVFTDPAVAEDYTRVASATVRGAEIEGGMTAWVDAVKPPETVTIYSTTWSSRTDRLSQFQSICLPDDRPVRLADRDVSDVEVSELADTGQVFALSVDSVDPEAGRVELLAVLSDLRKAGRLLPPDVDPYNGYSGMFMSALTPVLQDVENNPGLGQVATDTGTQPTPETTRSTPGDAYREAVIRAEAMFDAAQKAARAEGGNSPFQGALRHTKARFDAAQQDLARPYSWSQPPGEPPIPRVRRYTLETPTRE